MRGIVDRVIRQMTWAGTCRAPARIACGTMYDTTVRAMYETALQTTYKTAPQTMCEIAFPTMVETTSQTIQGVIPQAGESVRPGRTQVPILQQLIPENVLLRRPTTL